MAKRFPVIDPEATGRNLVRLRRAKGLSVRDLQRWFGFEEPRAIYKWQQGRSLPSLDNLCALCALLEVPMEELLVFQEEEENDEPQEESCGSFFSWNTAVLRGRERGDLPVSLPDSCRTRKHYTRPTGEKSWNPWFHHRCFSSSRGCSR